MCILIFYIKIITIRECWCLFPFYRQKILRIANNKLNQLYFSFADDKYDFEQPSGYRMLRLLILSYFILLVVFDLTPRRSGMENACLIG